MKHRTLLTFEVTKELKDKIKEVANNYSVNGYSCPLKSSAFCRMAIEILIERLEDVKTK